MSDTIRTPAPDLTVEVSVTGGSSTPVDSTLTRPGEAADAAVVGTALKELAAANPEPADAFAVLLECNALPTLIDKHGAILTDKSGTILLG